MQELLIGADPELFVRRNGHFISGHKFKLGTKSAPQKTKHGSVQVDGVALECNVTPASSEDMFLKNTRNVLNDLRELVTERDKTCKVLAVSVANFGKKALDKLPEEVRRLGCNPDYNAYTAMENAPPDAEVDFRTGAGHVHLGWTHGVDPMDPDHFRDCIRMTRQLDFVLGIQSLAWDRDKKRRELYGQAGAFRPKSYGMEYRVLSNVWVKHETTTRLVFRFAVRAFRMLEGGFDLTIKHGIKAAEIINNSEYSWAAKNPGLAEELQKCL